MSKTKQVITNQNTTNQELLNIAMQGMDITQYLDYRQFLEDLYKNSQAASARAQKQMRPLSYSKLSTLLGFKAENHFFLILKAQRGLSISQAQILARSLHFSATQEKFLEHLVMYSKENDTQKKQEWLDRMIHLRQKTKEIRDTNLDKFLGSWLNGIVFEILQSQEKCWTVNEIRNALKQNESVTKIKQSLETLLELGLCVQDNESYKSSRISEVISENTVHSASVTHFYNEVLQGASRSLMTDSEEERLMQTLTITLPASVKEKFGSIMEAFSKEMRNLLNQGDASENQITFQASLILFPVTQVISKKEK